MNPMVLTVTYRDEERKRLCCNVRYCTYIEQKGLKRYEELLVLVSVMLSVANTYCLCFAIRNCTSCVDLDQYPYCPNQLSVK